ncbi:50S ribosomal protein L4 [Phycisphaerales bacterium AB-hyl4]|uniref:Large ribosomal subunit protein uL4 n=1 Tax=Natronomicrosphaera hydrolytica TaxID=3242702 RepID=A0ABV4U908_9BACT
MIEIPVHNTSGEQVGTVQVDEQVLGGEVRHGLLKQAYVRYHANRRQGTVRTKNRSEVSHSTRKLYKQKGTGNARRGDMNANILRGGGHAFAKRPRDFRQDMPVKMRRLANRNALLAKLVDGEVKLIESISFEKPSTKQFGTLLQALKVDRSCLVALADTTGPAGRSTQNIDDVTLTQIDRLNAFDLLNHRYIVAEKGAFEQYIARITEQAAGDAGQKTEQEVAA